MTRWTPIVNTSDANLIRYEVNESDLTLEIRCWDDATRTISATGLSFLEDTGTWECDAIVLFPDLHDDQSTGYAIIDTEDKPTLKFRVQKIDTSEFEVI